MVNKRISSEGLVKLQAWVTLTQKKYIESLDEGISDTVRGLIDGHKSHYGMDLRRLYQRKKELEGELAIVSNEIKIRGEEIRQESEKRCEFEALKKRALEILVKKYKEAHGDFGKFNQILQHWAEALTVSQNELQKWTIDAAKIKGAE